MGLISIILRLCLLLTLTVLSKECRTGSKTKFDKFGVKFVVPSGWDVSSAYRVNNGNAVVICERKGNFTSNMITINVHEESSDLTSFLRDQITFHEETLAAMNPEFGPITNSSFNGTKSCRSEMTTKVSVIETAGYIECFHANGKNIVLMVTENVADTSGNKVPISKLLKSLKFGPDE